VKRIECSGAKRAKWLTVVSAPVNMTAVLDYREPVLIGDFQQRREIGGNAESMLNN